MVHPSATQLHDVVHHPNLFRPAEVSTGYIGTDIRLEVWDWPASPQAPVSLRRLQQADGWALTLNAGHYAGRELAPETRLLFTVSRTGNGVRASQILAGPFQRHALIERFGLNSAVEVRSAGYTQAVIVAERQVGVRRDPLAAYVLRRASFCARKHVWCAP